MIFDIVTGHINGTNRNMNSDDHYHPGIWFHNNDSSLVIFQNFYGHVSKFGCTIS